MIPSTWTQQYDGRGGSALDMTAGRLFFIFVFHFFCSSYLYLPKKDVRSDLWLGCEDSTLLQPRLHHHHLPRTPALPPQNMLPEARHEVETNSVAHRKDLRVPQATPHRSDRVSSTRGFGAANLDARLVHHRQQHSSRRHSTAPLSRSTDRGQPAQGSCPSRFSLHIPMAGYTLCLARCQRLVAVRWPLVSHVWSSIRADESSCLHRDTASQRPCLGSSAQSGCSYMPPAYSRYPAIWVGCVIPGDGVFAC